MMPIFNKLVIILSAVAVLSACALGGEKTRYRLIAPQVEAAGSNAGGEPRHTLAVARPETDRTRDSTRILVRRERTLLPWREAAWIDRAPDLVQDLLVEYLDGGVAVAGRAGNLPGEYRLDLVVRRFEMAQHNGELEADVELVARLFDATGQLLAVTTLSGREPAAGKALDDAVSAIETALGKVFTDLAAWVRSGMDQDADQ